MERCSDCHLCEYTPVQCEPKGSDNPSIYFVGEAPGPEEKEKGIPFIGRAGKYLHDLILSNGLSEANCRFFNVVRCFPAVEDNTDKFRTPTDEEMSCCIHYLQEDIEAHKPKVIVALGYTASRALVPSISGGITKNRGKISRYNDILVVLTYHPSYLMRNANNNKLRFEFKSDIKTAIELCIDPEKKLATLLKEDNKSGTKMCLTYDDFNEFCKEEIDNSSEVAYDVETNALEVHSINHRVVGFSLASNKDYGCYVPFNSLEFIMDPDDKRKIEDRLRFILSTKNVIQFNCLHELPVTLNWLNVDMKKIDDIFVMVKLMMGNAERYLGNGGLKAQSVEYLGYNDWSEDLDEYFSYVFNYDGHQENMRYLLSKYYSDNELDSIIEKVENVVYDVIPSLPKGQILSYEYVPCKLISRYGSIDSSVLFELRKFYYDWMEKESEKLGIDLFKGYKYWLMHHYAGYIIEKNGAYWNEEKASIIEQWCQENMLKSIKHLISSRLSEKYLRDKLDFQFNMYLKDNKLSEILGSNYTPKRNYKTSITVIPNNDNARQVLKNMSLLPMTRKSKGKVIVTDEYKLQLANIKTLAKRYLSKNPGLFDSWYRSYMDKFISEDHELYEYKDLMNPNATSSDFKEFVSEILINDMIIEAKTYSEIRKIVDDPNFDINFYKTFVDRRTGNSIDSLRYRYRDNPDSILDDQNIELIDNGDTRALDLVHKLEVSDMTPSQRLDIFIKFKNTEEGFTGKRRVCEAIMNSKDYKLATLDAVVMNELYDLYLMCHIDVEDSSTWTEEFEWLFNYKVYKKFMKLISTYINGKVGRKNVYLVDKKSYTDGDYFTRRENLYEGNVPEDKTLMMQQSFSVNTADTGRWQCFTGDMRIPEFNTTNSYSFKELVDKGIKELWVYSRDKNNLITPALAINPIVTKKVTKLAYVTFENGYIVKCTPDHRFRLLDGSYKEAQYLDNDELSWLTDNPMRYNVEIVDLDYPVDVYDIEVPEFHNFVLEGGMFVHNSGMHNLPASDAIKGIYTSRFKGGCISMPDGSQMEVRTLAAECGDENLIKAFRDGVDIHRFFASKIYRVDYDKVEKWQRGLAKNAVFGMIYGESEKAFADSYLKGDLIQAEKVFNDMFTGFPKIKEYIERAQNQFKQFSKVTTITQRYINVSDPQLDFNTLLRRAQNYPIQAAAEDLAGIILYKLCEYINENNMKSKIFCFIHDSIEIDMHPDEVFQLVDRINYLFNEFPLKEFGVPVACDIPLGPNMGSECEVSEFEHDDEYNEVSFDLEGFISDIEELVSSWREVYKLVEVSEIDGEEDKEEYIPWSDAFLPKKARISMNTGKYRTKGKRRLHIIRK